MSKTYNKLVRDKIPELIEASGKEARIRILDEDEYVEALERKLDEEVAEFHESGVLEELADILEVLYALAEVQGAAEEDLHIARLTKRKERGGFKDRILLESVE